MSDRLSATDAAFLYSEDRSAPQHVGGVVILDPAADPHPRPFDYASLVDLIGSRLSLVPRYRQRVRVVPGRLARPVWVDDDAFDITYHVRRSTLPGPGSAADLDDLVGRLISRPLDRDRPLWEVYVVEGLADGRVAVVNKTHPALVDRIGAVDVAAAILDLRRRPRRLPEQPWLPAPAPSDVDLVVDAIADLAARPAEVAELARAGVRDVGSVVVRAAHVGTSVVDAVRRTVRPSPRSMLSVSRPGQRLFATARLELSALKTVRAAHGGSVNDVVLAVVTAALRTFLLSHGEPVTATRTVRALIPVTVHAGRGDAGDDGVPDGQSDRVVSYLIDLPVAEANPLVRLHQVSFAMRAHAESGRQVGAEALMELGRFAPPTLHALGARVAGQLSGRRYDVLISNAPGPQVPLYAAGWSVLAMYPVAPLGSGQALSIAVTSYRGGVFFGLTADRDAIADVGGFAEHLSDALVELVALIPEPDGRGGNPDPLERNR